MTLSTGTLRPLLHRKTLGPTHAKQIYGTLASMNEVTTGLYVESRKNLGNNPNLVRIRSGVYFDSSVLTDSMQRWDLRREMTRLRCEAQSLTRKGSGAAPIFTGEAALCLWGTETWFTVPDLQAWRADGTKTRWHYELPPVSINGEEISGCTYRTIEGTRLGSESYLVHGCQVVSEVEAVVDLARYGHPLQTIMAASAVMRKLSGFTIFDQEEPRKKAEEIRQEMLAILRSTSHRYRTAEAAILAADPGCDGPGEAFMRWQLAMVTDINEVVTQRKITQNGHTYYIDAAVKGTRCGWEFDGSGKVDAALEARNKFLSRQNDLLQAGVRLMRLSTADYRDPAATLQKVLHHLHACGVVTRAPSKYLNKAFPPAFFDSSRRN